MRARWSPRLVQAVPDRRRHRAYPVVVATAGAAPHGPRTSRHARMPADRLIVRQPRTYRLSISILFIDTLGVAVKNARLDSWLQRLRVTATFIYIIALCVAVAVLVIAFIPHSSVTTVVPAEDVAGLDHVTGVATGVTLDPAGTIAVEIAEPSTAQRLLYLIVVLPASPWSHSSRGAWPSCSAQPSRATLSPPRPSERSIPLPRSPRQAESPCGR